MSLTIRQGFAEADRAEVAALYWQAFGPKLGRVLAPEPKALAFVARVMRADHALAAYDQAGRFLGAAGFKSRSGAFVGGRPGDLSAIYGWFGGRWRAVFLNLLSRNVENERFLMDGLFVRYDCRGTGLSDRDHIDFTPAGQARMTLLFSNPADEGLRSTFLREVDLDKHLANDKDKATEAATAKTAAPPNSTLGRRRTPAVTSRQRATDRTARTVFHWITMCATAISWCSGRCRWATLFQVPSSDGRFRACACI